MKEYHVFYVYAVGYESRYEKFDSEDGLLAFILKARADPEYSSYRNVRVVYGELLEFEPQQVVSAWRIK